MTDFDTALEDAGAFEGKVACEACDEDGESTSQPGTPCKACDGWGWRDP